jgi:hypothetical protein
MRPFDKVAGSRETFVTDMRTFGPSGDKEPDLSVPGFFTRSPKLPSNDGEDDCTVE